MKLVGVGMTTSVDLHGDCFTREALLKVQADINGSRCISVGLEHNPAIPPLGKVLAGEIQDRADGVTELVITEEIFEHESWLTLSDGTIVFKAESDADRRPFITPEGDEETELSIDPNSLPEGTSSEIFFQAVAAENGIAAFRRRTHLRKAVTLDPEIVVTIGKLAVVAFFGSKLVEKLVERLADEMSADAVKLYRLLRAAILTFARYPWNRPTCYVIQVPGDPFIEFVAKTSNPHLLLDALTAERCWAALDKAISLQRLFGATKVQFLLSEYGQWEFNFLLTRDGAVIGSEASYVRRGQILRAFIQRAAERVPDERYPQSIEGSDV